MGNNRISMDRRPLRNVLIGNTVENQQQADLRYPAMETIHRIGWRTFVSYEPALGPVDWAGWQFLDWMISGGESGQNARPSHPDWHRAARDFATANGFPYHFKQWGEWKAILDRDGEDPDWRQPYSRWDRNPRFRFLNAAAGCGFHGDRLHVMERVGKKAAGRLLDGKLHNEFPRAV